VIPQMLKEIKNLVAFLTIIPVGMDHDLLKDAAKWMPLFPLVGAFIGLLAGIFAWLTLQILPETIVGVLTLGFMLLITGLHHTDGLLDFGDGLMYYGSPEKKIQIMHDQLTGAGGLTLGMITLLTTALGIASLRMDLIIPSLIVSEVSAKLSMVVGAWVGKSAHQGMNENFIGFMHGQHRNSRLLLSIVLSFSVSALLFWTVGCIAVIVGIITGLVIVGVSYRHLRGITGDVLGAMNEIARLTSILTILVVSR